MDGDSFNSEYSRHAVVALAAPWEIGSLAGMVWSPVELRVWSFGATSPLSWSRCFVLWAHGPEEPIFS